MHLIRRKRSLLAAAVILAGALIILRSFTASGVIVIEDGKAYRVLPLIGSRILLDELYDPGFYAANYTETGGRVYRIDPDSGQRYAVYETFSDDFEGADRVNDLIGPERGWTNFTLQSPGAPTVEDYNRVRHAILDGTGDFVDNRIDPSPLNVHGGTRALRAFAAAPTADMVCSKASLSTLLLHFRQGDDVWFRAWFLLETGVPFCTLMDLESTFAKNHPGMRIRLKEMRLDIEQAKWVSGSVYRQAETAPVMFPAGQWVQVKLHLRLSAGGDGIIALWQDNRPVLAADAQTLPFEGAVYDSMEVGLSALALTDHPAVLYVDDIIISHKPFE